MNHIPDINNLILIAAPAGAGKTTLLESPSDKFENKIKEDDLNFLNEDFLEHIQIGEESLLKEKILNRLIIHIDLLRFAYYPKPREVNFRKIKENNLLGHPLLSKRLISYIERSRKIIVLTCFINPHLNFQRFVSRALDKNIKLSPYHAAILGSNWRNGELQKSLYKYWESFLVNQKIKTTFYLNICGEKYYIISKEKYLNAINIKSLRCNPLPD